jgi:DNA-directed RNA polymerase sigma subunit (sigma70/sigma32)
VEEEIVRSLDIERVRAALKALTPEERDIIMNFYFSENPLLGEALAEKFATTKSSIYRRRDHALRKLKSILGNA